MLTLGLDMPILVCYATVSKGVAFANFSAENKLSSEMQLRGAQVPKYFWGIL